jgi:hypothetical protein
VAQQISRAGGGAVNPPPELYLYRASDNSLRCASCPREGVGRYGSIITPEISNGLREVHVAIRPNYLSRDGVLFFSGYDRLTQSDVNGVADVYQYDPQYEQPHLISTGRGDLPAMYGEASPDGRNVFFVTRQQLVAGDGDRGVDLYDARIGGGFPDQRVITPPCDGDACQPVGVPAPAPSEVASAATGRGNLRESRHPRRRCHRNHKRVRCIKTASHHPDKHIHGKATGRSGK